MALPLQELGGDDAAADPMVPTTLTSTNRSSPPPGSPPAKSEAGGASGSLIRRCCGRPWSHVFEACPCSGPEGAGQVPAKDLAQEVLQARGV
jgi:hypothetical protein